MPSHRQPALRTVVAVFCLLACSHGSPVNAQSAPRRVTHSAAGISMVAPAGWHQLEPRPGSENSGPRVRSLLERQAFLEQTADAARTTLFLFVKDLSVANPQQTPNTLIRVTRAGPLGPRSVPEMIAAMAAQRDPRLVGPIESTRVSGLPAVRATLRETAVVGAETFPVLAFGHFVPLDSVLLVIDMKAPASSPEAANTVFAEALASIRIDR